MCIRDRLKTAAVVKERLEAIAAKKNVKIAVTGEDAEITGGESLVFEMLYNLCDNAVKYNKENGNVTVSVGTSEGAPFVTVKDTGCLLYTSP